MEQYFKYLKHILKHGQLKNNRTNTKTLSTFGYQMRFDLSKGFPILTTKKVNFHAIKVELLWFISGNTNIKFLVDNQVNIWNEWPYETYKKSSNFQNETQTEFINKIKNDTNFAKKHGNLGPVYGKQWRNFFGIDQLKNLLEEIKNNKNSRRLIVSAWNPAEINTMLLPPCHCFFQFYVDQNDKLSCLLYQRSADSFLGVPFNIASYSLLTFLIAKNLNLQVGEFIHTIGDAHIYVNHLDQIKQQLQRKFLPLPKLVLNPEITSIFDYKIEDINLDNYQSHEAIKGDVAI